jgi:hypothetical protein
MPFITVNGLQLGILNDNADESNDIIGERERAFSGTLLSSVRAVKRSWALKTEPLGSAVGVAWAGLFNGVGHRWGFDDSTYYAYSSKGLGYTTLVGTLTRRTATPSPKFGSAYIRLTAGGSLTYGVQVPLSSPWALMVWRYESGTSAWHHYIKNSDGTKYRDGAVYGGSIDFLDMLATAAILGDAASIAPQDFDDFVSVPFVIPASWAAVLGVATSAFSDLPRLEVAGDFIRETSLQVEGEEVSTHYIQFYDNSAGAWDGAGRELSFTIREV